MESNGAHPNLYTRPMVEAWSGLLRRAVESKREFTNRGEQVQEFWNGGPDFMWSPNYIARFMGGNANLQPPKFKVAMNKAFEYVALFGPMLYWQMARRKAKPHRQMPLDPMVLAGDDPMQQEFFGEKAQQQANEDARSSMRASIIEHVLNYLQREQPYGGLGVATASAIQESLIRGASFLETRPYWYPESQKTLVGSFFVSCEDVLVDPDCKDPLWEGAMWIARRHRQSFWQVEERFGLPPGSLRGMGTSSSYGSGWSAGRTDLPPNRHEDHVKDQLEWYEIYSRAGCGNKLCGTKQVIEPEFDAMTGDYVYMCVSKNVPWPLNLPSQSLLGEQATPEWIKEQLSWPTDYWRDNKWPISKLSYYDHSGTSAWPEPPLSPAIGELMILNILISAYVQTAYESRQSVIGVVQGAIEDLQGIIQSNKSPLIVELQPGLSKSINDVMSFMQRPNINGDIPKTIEFMMGVFEKRTGMLDMMYGGNTGANPRSASEYNGKMSTVNIRPEYMQKKVAEWQSAVAEKEVFALYQHVQAKDLEDQLGPLGTLAYEMLVTNENAETILRGSKYYVEASEMSRPNKAHDAQILQSMSQYLMPILTGHATQYNDFGPLNGFIAAIGDSSDIDVTEFLMQLPPPDENEQRMQQATAEANLQKLQAEAAKLQAEAQSLMGQGESSQAEFQLKQAELQSKLVIANQLAQFKQAQAEHAMSLKEMDAQTKAGLASQGAQLKHADAVAKLQAMQAAAGIKNQAALQGMQLQGDAHEHDMEAKVSAAEIESILKRQQLAQAEAASSQSLGQRERQANMQLLLEIAKSKQGMQQQQDTHQQSMLHADANAAAEAKRSNAITFSKMLAATAMADQRKSQQTKT